MSTYRNEKSGFELELPDDWGVTSGFSRIPFMLANIFQNANILEEFSNHAKDNLNIVVEKMLPEIPPDICELIFTLNARKMKYTDVKFCRITASGCLHACATYVMNLKGFLKKYMIVLNGYGYALTASCPIDQKSLKTEETWDGIASSLRLLNPVDSSVAAFNNSPQAKRLIAILRTDLIKQLEE